MKTIICIEGLGGEIFGWCRKPLIKKGYHVKWYPWWWPKIPLYNDCICIGHSLGGGRLIRELNNQKITPKLSITLDPRLDPEEGFRIKLSSNHFNFYQKGFMPGFVVNGAYNTLVEDMRHTELPSHISIITLIDGTK